MGRSIKLEFKEKAFKEWEDNTHIPDKIMNMVKWISEKIGYSIYQEETIQIKNVWGIPIGYGKGFTIYHCTSSLANGPSPDYSKEFSEFLQGLGFEIANSYGDNGLDSATNWRDTYWYHDFVYQPSITTDDFLDFPEDATEEEIDDYYEEQEYRREMQGIYGDNEY